MKNILAIIIIACLFNTSYSQSISSSVIASSGGFYSSPSSMLSFTTAEMTMVQFYTTTSAILDQGFQQPTDIYLGVKDYTDKNSPVRIFPNPTNQFLNISFLTNNSSHMVASIFDILGNVIYKKEIQVNGNSESIILDLSTLSSGIYMLELLNTDVNKSSLSIYTQKIQLIN